MLLALAGLVIRDAKLDFPIEMQFLQKRQQITLSSISLVQTAHRIEPIARQREDQARLGTAAARQACCQRGGNGPVGPAARDCPRVVTAI
jgi:hypothetical protein